MNVEIKEIEEKGTTVAVEIRFRPAITGYGRGDIIEGLERIFEKINDPSVDFDAMIDAFERE